MAGKTVVSDDEGESPRILNFVHFPDFWLRFHIFCCFLSIFAEDVEVEDNEGEPLDEEDRRRHDDDEDEEDGASFIIVSRD